VELKIQYKRDKAYSREIWNYNKGDYENLLEDLESFPWGTGLNTFENIDDMADFWSKSFLDTCK
jgi:hypothetical protein